MSRAVRTCVILGHALWQRLFGADRRSSAASVMLADKPHTVIGVMPASFESISRAGLLRPAASRAHRPWRRLQLHGHRPAAQWRVASSRRRLKPRAIWQAFSAEFPDVDPAQRASVRIPGAAGDASRCVRPALLVMSGAVGLLLLIACANTANLLLARAAGPRPRDRRSGRARRRPRPDRPSDADRERAARRGGAALGLALAILDACRRPGRADAALLSGRHSTCGSTAPCWPPR